MLIGRWLERGAVSAALVTTLTLGLERIDPSLGLTPDLRLTNLRAAAALTLVLWLLACCVRRRRPRIPRPVALPAAVWLACVSASAWLAPSYQTQALAFARDLTFGVAFGWAVYNLAESRSRQLLLARAFALGGLVVAVVGLIEATRVRPVVEWLAGFRYQTEFSIGEINRVSATLPHPNIAAMFLGLTLPVLMAWCVTTRTIWIRVLAAVGTVVELAVLVLTVSRAGMLVMEVVLGLMLVVAWWRHSLLLAALSVGALIALPVLVGLSVAAQPLLLLHFTGEGVEGWYRADYSTPDVLTAQAGQATLVPVQLANTGARTWDARGEHPFALSYHLDQVDGALVTFDGPRTPLPHDVAPGAVVDLQAELVAPPTPGGYLVEWDEVQESVTWFSWAGNPARRTYLIVGGPLAASSAGPTWTQTLGPASAPPPPPDRLTLWRIALRMARNRPLLGVGPDNFRWVYGDFAGLSRWDTGSHANSVYFEWLADTGVLGLGVFLWLAWRLVRTSVEGLLRPFQSPRSDTWWMWRLALVASLVVWFLHGILDYFYAPLPTNLGFWFVAALALSAARMDSTVCG
jgi:O-antigen ligase